MEFLLHFWDDLDDVTAASRHLATAAMEEFMDISVAVRAAVVAFAFSMLRFPQ